MLVGEVVTPWVRFPGQSGFKAGTARVQVADDGGFTWGRRTGKRVSVYFTHASTRSNTITITAR